jgi:acyl dehydratase
LAHDRQHFLEADGVTVLEFTRAPSVAALMLRAAATGLRRPDRVDTLAAVTRVLLRCRVDPANLARYRALCGMGAAPGTPMTYPQLLGFPLLLDFLASSDCPWPALGLIHLANRIEQIEPVTPGDELRVELSAGALLSHPKGQAFALDMRVLRAGRLVWQATQTLLKRGQSDPVGPNYEALESGSERLVRHSSFDAPADIGRRYARLSGDFNPIHLWPLTARLFGFKRAIAHGLWSQAKALALLDLQMPGGHAVLETQFMTPLSIPAHAGLWRGGATSGLHFELRDAQGDRVHLRSRWQG